MGARKQAQSLTRVSSARLRWLSREMKAVRDDHRGAKGAESWSAVAAFRRQLQALRLEYDQEHARLEEEQARATAQAAQARELTPEERAEELSRLVDRASDDELEVALKEWLRRRRYRFEVDEGGTLHLVPFGEAGLTVVAGGKQ